MTELLNGRRFEGRAAGKGAAPPRTAPQRSGNIASRCPILRSSFGPNLGQIGRKMAKLLHFLLKPEMAPRRHFRFEDRRQSFIFTDGHYEEASYQVS